MMASSSVQTEIDDVVDVLRDIEAAAEDVLADKAHLIELDKRRNVTREASRAITKLDTNDSRLWFCVGRTFLKLPVDKAKMIVEADLSTINKEINEVRDGLKPKVDRLYEMEGKDRMKQAFHLKPMDVNHLDSIDS